MPQAKRKLEDAKVPVRIRLALLWASLMSLYIYNDYFSLYRPGTIADMSAGRMGPLGPATPAVMIAVSLLLAVPALMIFLSSVLPPGPCRWLNVVLGFAYTAIEGLTITRAVPSYQIVVALEIALTLAIVWHAFRWPRIESAHPETPAA